MHVLGWKNIKNAFGTDLGQKRKKEKMTDFLTDSAIFFSKEFLNKNYIYDESAVVRNSLTKNSLKKGTIHEKMALSKRKLLTHQIPARSACKETCLDFS